jgi:hypothetical protein
VRPRRLVLIALVLLPLQLVAGPVGAQVLYLCQSDDQARTRCCCPQHPGEEPAGEDRIARTCCCDIEAPAAPAEPPAGEARAQSPAAAHAWLALAAPAPVVVAPPPAPPPRLGPTDRGGPPGPPPLLQKHAFLC